MKVKTILSFIFLFLLTYPFNIYSKDILEYAFLTNPLDEKKIYFPRGEELIYDVYYLGVKIGEAILKFHGERVLEGKKFYYITFTTKLPFLKDIENIYADKQTLLPYRVVRNIKRVGSLPLKVYENYDQKNYNVRIREKNMLSSKEYTIRRKAPMQNAILLTYFCRLIKDIDVGDRFKVVLPTVEFDVIVAQEDVLKIKLADHPAYKFISEPKKFVFWLSKDDARIPLKINSLILKGYSLVIRSIRR